MQLTINIPDFAPLTFNMEKDEKDTKINEKHNSEIIDFIKSDTKLDTVFKKGLIKFIDTLKRVPIHLNKDSYFISEKHKLEFCILKHEGNYLDEELGITRKHYVDKDIAKEWRNRMQEIFHDDKNFNNERYTKVSSKINKIYERMIGKA